MSHNKPVVHAIGNAHLDPAWMWTWGEGAEAFLATCRAALDRMDETPQFVFTCGSAAHYKWVEDLDTDLFARIRRRVAQGRWHITGGWWLQADCNIPSGEGFARQALYGQRYFLDRFGLMARTGYSVDAFGHNAGLPQLLADAGMNAYVFCRPDPDELHLPSPLIRWFSPDGSNVLAYRVPFHYNMYQSSIPKKIDDITNAFVNTTGLADAPLNDYGSQWAVFYGVGNHGGGPTREHIAQLLAAGNHPAQPDVLFSSPDQFIAATANHTIPEWHDDLQLNAPGCYTAHSLIKKLNRQSENELARAETLSALSCFLTGADYPSDELRRAWQDVCFNHFHDIVCGVAIRQACDDAVHQYGAALHTATTLTRHAVLRIAGKVDTSGPGQTLLVFNHHSFGLDEHITFELWHDIDKSLWSQPVHVRVTDSDGDDLPSQIVFPSGKIGKDRIAVTFPATAPALGWNCYRVHYGEQSPATTTGVAAGDTFMENDLLRVEVSAETGAITRLLHKPSGRELLNGQAGLPVAFHDPTDTWGHGVTRFDNEAGRFARADVRLVESGPCHATIRTRSHWRNSWVQQDFRLYYGSDRVDVNVKLFWAEQHTMLKLAFGTSVQNPAALCEGAYCAVPKPCDGTERPAGRWIAVVNGDDPQCAGFGIANDAKHGFSADGHTLWLSVLRSPGYATHDPHTYSPDEDVDYMDQGVQRFAYTIVPLHNRDSLSTLHQQACLLNAPPLPHLESAHQGDLPRRYQGISVEGADVVATVIKGGEDDDGWVVRLHQSTGHGGRATITLPALGTEWLSDFAPYEVQTWKIIDGEAIRTNLLEL